MRYLIAVGLWGAVVAILLLIALISVGQNSREFRKICEESGGRVAYDGRQSQCIQSPKGKS